MYRQKRNGDPEEIRITVYKNNVGGKKLPKLFGKTKGATYVIEQLPSPLKPESYSREAGKASFNSSPDHMSESVRRGTQNCRKQKPTKVGYVFRDILLRRLENRRSHIIGEKV
ncbi:hypothetical protein L3X16_05205 [Pseudomonas stutzeri]|nr:hypothetical protein [Stutzerimonas stutzeri]